MTATLAPDARPLPDTDGDIDRERLGAQLDAIRDAVLADLGQRDAEYIRGVIRLQRTLEIAGRGMLMFGFLPPAFFGGVTALSLSKILDNMEIGHNVMHGQYDWMGDPALDSSTFEWDTACPGEQWRHSHNYLHHTFTNIRGKDRDVGYGILRMTDEEEWKVHNLGNLVYAAFLAMLFQYGVALHDVEVEQPRRDAQSRQVFRDKLGQVWEKTRTQWLKDYALFPALAGPAAPVVFAGNMTANLVRNLWSFTIIFCGHFPQGVETFSEEEADDESRGAWYERQLRGSANLEGGKVFDVLSGNLSYQIEHHAFPDLPAHRYADIAPQVRAVCDEHGLAYNSGGLGSQFASVVGRISSLALPGREDESVVSRLGSLVDRLNPFARSA